MMRHNSSTTELSVKNISVEDNAIISMITDERPSDRMGVEEAYRKVGWFRRCVDLRAEAFAGIPFTIRRKTTGRVLYDSEQFGAPPDNLTWAAILPDLLRLQEMSIIMYGREYWRPLRDQFGWPTGIQHLYPRFVKEEYNSDGTVANYKRTVVDPKSGGSREISVPADQIVAFYNRSPLSEIDGAGIEPLAEAARVNADVLYSLDKWLDNHMDRGLLPATIIAVPANTPPEARNNLQAWWDRAFRGKNNAGRQKVMNADAVTVHNVGEGLKDFGIETLIMPQREAIATLLGIPMSQLLSTAANRATAFQADEDLYTKALMPRARRAQNDMNEGMFNEIGLHFRFEFDRIKALQRANLDTARSLEKITNLVIDEDEARNFIGLEPLTEQQRKRMKESKPSPAPQMPPNGDDFEPMNEEAKSELGKWKWKAERKGAMASFDPEHIPEYVHRAVKARLEAGESVEDAFEPPFFGI